MLIDSQTPKTYIYQGSRHLTENKNDLLQLIDSRFGGTWKRTMPIAGVDPSSSIQLSATGRLLDITHMCYEYRTPLLSGQLRQPRQSDLSVTSTLQLVNRWCHNEYSCCSHPSRSYICEAHLLWRSDQLSGLMVRPDRARWGGSRIWKRRGRRGFGGSPPRCFWPIYGTF